MNELLFSSCYPFYNIAHRDKHNLADIMLNKGTTQCNTSET
jgi:hypothetical protein